ncbi:oligosaccharide flippase family protein [Cetobacterium sp.]|uniref:lipopolysaccharide biosynthesis protein n=1 Tax=Cetobacterium sp. TaxID=2071632 RepID=UPI0025BDB22A|nr:oligosaccharide flippase family protein [Cetobacterium sp.]
MLKEKIRKIKANNLLFNILSNFIFKGLGIGISFISIPIMLKYLDKNNYGLWMLILSITNWIYTFDIGIGNGLKNRLAESLSKKNEREAKEYIATSYFFVTIISVVFFLFLYIILHSINLSKLLNIDYLNNNELNKILIINIGFVCINFIFSLCNNIFLGSQKAYLSSINSVLSQVLFFVFLLGLFYLKENSMVLLSLSYGLGIFLSHIILTSYYFYKNNSLLFEIKNISFTKTKNIFGIGLKIFLVQISGLIIFSTDNFIITKYTGIENVAVYNIVNKLFGIPLLIMSLITAPIWPAVTKAFYEGNKEWLENVLKKLQKIFYLLLVLTIIIIILGKSFVKIWTLNEINPSFSLIITCGLATLLTCFSNIYSTIIFGIGVSWNLVFIALFQAIINIVVSLIAIIYFDLGIIGVVLGTCFSMLTNIFILPKSLKIMIGKI